MIHVLKIVRYELGRNVQRKGYLFTTFGLPVLMIAISLFIQFAQNQATEGQSPEEVAEQLQFDFGSIETVGYVDLSGVFATAKPSDDLQAFTDQASAEAALAAGEIDTIYVIPADFNESGDVTQIVPEISLNTVSSEPVKKLIFSTIEASLDEAEIPPTLLARLQNPANVNIVDLQRTSVDEAVTRNEDTDFALVYGFGILFLVTVFGTSGYLMQSVIEEKETRLVEILLSSVRPTELLAGKIIALGLLGLAQILAWIAIGFAFFTLQSANGGANPLSSIYIPLETLPILIIYFVVGYLMFAAAFGGVGALSSSISEGPQFSMIFALPIIGTFYVFPSFISAPDSALPTFLSLFPLTSPLAMVMRSVVSAVPAWQVILSLVLLILGMLGMFWVAGRMFRVQTLLAGQVPKLRELPKLIFGR